MRAVRLIAAATALLAALVLCACGGSSDSTGNAAMPRKGSRDTARATPSKKPDAGEKSGSELKPPRHHSRRRGGAGRPESYYRHHSTEHAPDASRERATFPISQAPSRNQRHDHHASTPKPDPPLTSSKCPAGLSAKTCSQIEQSVSSGKAKAPVAATESSKPAECPPALDQATCQELAEASPGGGSREGSNGTTLSCPAGLSEAQCAELARSLEAE